MSRARGYPISGGNRLNTVNIARLVEAGVDTNEYPYCAAYDYEKHLIVVISLDGGMQYQTEAEAEAALPGCAIPEEWKGDNPPREWMPLLTDEPAAYVLHQWDW